MLHYAEDADPDGEKEEACNNTDSRRNGECGSSAFHQVVFSCKCFSPDERNTVAEAYKRVTNGICVLLHVSRLMTSVRTKDALFARAPKDLDEQS